METVTSILSKDKQMRNQMISSIRFTRQQNTETKANIAINQELIKEVKELHEIVESEVQQNRNLNQEVLESKTIDTK